MLTSPERPNRSSRSSKSPGLEILTSPHDPVKKERLIEKHTANKQVAPLAARVTSELKDAKRHKKKQVVEAIRKNRILKQGKVSEDMYYFELQNSPSDFFDDETDDDLGSSGNRTEGTDNVEPAVYFTSELEKWQEDLKRNEKFTTEKIKKDFAVLEQTKQWEKQMEEFEQNFILNMKEYESQLDDSTKAKLVKELDLQKSDVAKWKLNFITDVENLQKTLQQPSDINKLTRKLDQLRLKMEKFPTTPKNLPQVMASLQKQIEKNVPTTQTPNEEETKAVAVVTEPSVPVIQAPKETLNTPEISPSLSEDKDIKIAPITIMPDVVSNLASKPPATVVQPTVVPQPVQQPTIPAPVAPQPNTASTPSTTSAATAPSPAPQPSTPTSFLTQTIANMVQRTISVISPHQKQKLSETHEEDTAFADSMNRTPTQEDLLQLSDDDDEYRSFSESEGDEDESGDEDFDNTFHGSWSQKKKDEDEDEDEDETDLSGFGQ